MTMDLGSVKKDFSALLSQIQPWTLSHFVMWLDIKVAEYKVFGHMILDNTPNDTPQWLRGKTYLDQYKDPSETSPSPTPAPSLSPRSSHPATSIRSGLQMYSTAEPIVSLATSPNNGLYTVSTVNTTVVSPSVSPAYPNMSQNRSHLPPTETYHKPSPPLQSPDLYSKLPPIAQFHGFPSQETQRIPPISHLSPKNIRQSHLEHNLSLTRPAHLGKDSLTPAEVETQIAVLQSQIAAVNRNLNQSQVPQANDTLSQPAQRGRKTSHEITDMNSSYSAQYTKRSRQQSPVGSRSSTETLNNTPAARTEVDMLSRYHRMETESVADPSRGQSLQSISELMRSQSLQSTPESLRAQSIINSMEAQRLQSLTSDPSIQNTAQDMTIAHSNTDRDIQHSGSSRVHVKTEASDEDSSGTVTHSQSEAIMEDSTPCVPSAQTEETVEDSSPQSYPVGMYPSPGNSSGNTEDKAAADITTKKMRRKFLESMKNSNPKYYSHQIQQIIPFPEKFPVSNLDYGLKALQMIQTGEITRAGKIQLIDTIFHELIKYTGLYPTPTQKMAVANSIVETFPTLAAKMKASHISPADSWYVILCDKFRNERRGLSGGGTPRVGKIAKMVKQETGQAADSSEETPEPTPTEEAPAEESPQPQAQVVPQRLHNVFSPPPQTQSPSQTQAQPTYSSHSSAAHMPSPAYPEGYVQPQGKDNPKGNQAQTDSSDDEDDDQNGEKLLMDTKEKQMYAEQITKSLKKRTQSSSTDVSDILLDERYAASLLQYYSKHKPFYPAYSEANKTAYTDATKQSYAGYTDPSKLGDVYAADEALAQQYAADKLASQQLEQEMQATAQREESTDVSTIVQTVVEAHMDEIMASRSHQGTYEGQSGCSPQEEGSSSEVPPISKIFSKKKPRPAPREQSAEQLQVKQQRFIHKVSLTFPGVRVLDEATLECTCGTKVKLGRPRMLHNYTNYHLRRCPVPPAQPSGALAQGLGYDQGSMSLPGQGSMYDLSGDPDAKPESPPPGSLDIPMPGPPESDKGSSIDLSQTADIPYAASTSASDGLSTADLQIPTSGPEVAQEQTVETMEMPEPGQDELQESMMITIPRPGLEGGTQENVLPELSDMEALDMEQEKQGDNSQPGPVVDVVVETVDEPMNLANT